jgi:Insulinase (Peptidase family M16)
MSVSNDDENKAFGAVFRTPVDDSTGIPHILEHSVLNGSKKYPVKEPFVELIKGSLHTFINAFTYPDRTCYPVASTNLQVCLFTSNKTLREVPNPTIQPLLSACGLLCTVPCCRRSRLQDVHASLLSYWILDRQ